MSTPEDDKTLRNLGILSLITQNDKLNTKEDTFSIYVPTTWRGMMRYVYNENREHNIEKIQSCIREAKKFITANITNSTLYEDDQNNFSMKFEHEARKRSTTRMVSALQKSKKGLESLLITYKEDASAMSKLQIIIDEMDDFINTTHRTSPTRNGELCIQLQ